jgi:diguanylate cyclase (GGDEF)-like protein/PAS domain S-box-containing protein
MSLSRAIDDGAAAACGVDLDSRPAFELGPNEAARLEAMKALALLDTPSAPGFDRVCQMASELLQAPIALISFLDEDRQWFKARIGLGVSETDRSLAFCNHTILGDDVFVVTDAANDPRFSDNALVTGEPKIGSYAGAPLIISPGIRLGSLCVIHHQPREFDEAECELLSELSQLVVSEIELHRATRAALATQEALFTTEQRYLALLEANSAMVWRAQADGQIVDISLSGPFADTPRSDFLGLSWIDMIYPDDRRPIVRRALRASGRAMSYDGTHRIRMADGSYRWTRMRVVPLLDASGKVSEWMGKCIDEHDRHLAEESLRKSEERLRLALTAGRMVAWEYHPKTSRMTRSGDLETVLGLKPDDEKGFGANVHPDDRRKLVTAFEAGGVLQMDEIRYLHPDGHLMWLASRGAEIIDNNGERRVIGVTFDITERKASEERVWLAAHHDSLTGLANRGYFQAHLEETLHSDASDDTTKALILLDIDDFKGVNDAIGHEAGDEILRQTAERLRKVVGVRGMIARLGSDEFGILLNYCKDADAALELTEHILDDLSKAVYRNSYVLACGASAGIALFPDHDRSASELMKDAEMALYSAKAEGRGRALIYASHMREVVEVRIKIASQMREALASDEIVPFYQPKIDLQTGAIVGFEALARWRHPTRGLLTPGVFASAFDTPELALGIGRKVVDGILRDLQDWLDLGLVPGPIAVNLSAADFGENGLARHLLGLLDEAAIPAHFLSVEVTETVFLGKGGGNVGAILQDLHDGGIRIALDDFGTGFASLTHLKQFPIDDIKIDQSFVRNLGSDEDDAAIVSAVIALGQSLGLGVIAEGVETLEQAELLRARGCPQAQGYLFAKPMMASRVAHFLRSYRPGEEIDGSVAALG